jgi:sugar transferase (PEP-CTERM/EpsH1 system associated)
VVFVKGDPANLKILVVTPSVPYPPNWGFGIRVFNLLRELAQTNSVSLVCFAAEGDGDKVRELLKFCEAVHTVPSPLANNVIKRGRQLRSTFSRRSFQSTGTHSGEMVRLMRQVLAEGDFDLVQLESSQLVSSFPSCSMPIVLDEHNIEYELLRRMVDVERSALRKAYNWIEYRKFRKEETGAWVRVDACVLTSDREYEIVRAALPSKALLVAPNGVDIDYFKPSDAPTEPNSIVFTGLMSYRPNVDAVKFFVREILPRIVVQVPNVKFKIVGLEAEQNVGFLAGPHVEVISDVPDVRPYIESASIVAVPLRMGSGTRLKVLDALAMSKPMVSTSVGCEGIAVKDGQHLIVADGPEKFADAILGLLADPAHGRRLGAAGRQLVEAHYSWASIARSLADFHAAVLRTARGTQAP